ncbi:MAG: hypothetical protein FWH11_07695 [Micrococcales bacterium]|nr:hypothetical protein [Micrococcales bacterium]
MMHTSTVVAGAVHQLGDILRSRLRVQTTEARDTSVLVLDDRSAVIVDRGDSGDLLVTLWERLVPDDASGQRWSTPGYQTLVFSKTGALPERTWARVAAVTQTENAGVAVRAVVHAVRGQAAESPPWRFACDRGDVWDLTVGQPIPASCPNCGSGRIVRAAQAVRRPAAEEQ